MPSLELNPTSNRYHIRFRFGGKSFKRSLKTSDKVSAQAAVARVSETILLVERGVIEMPTGADVATFLLSNGRRSEKPKLECTLTLRDLFAQYLTSLPSHAKEDSTLETEQIHLRHFERGLPLGKPIGEVTTAVVQSFVNKQLHRRFRNRPLKPETVKRQIATLRGIFNWAIKQRIYDGPLPTSGLVFPKQNEQPPFRTRVEIERVIKRGGLNGEQTEELWHSLYLTTSEVHEILNFVKQEARYPFIYPMFAFVAYTGARRSEMMRALIDDFELKKGTVLIRERKRSRSKSTTYRRVELPSALVEIMLEWFGQHPGGQHAFCHDFGIVSDHELRGLTRDQARIQFKKTLRGSAWSVVRGFHVFRHSYASNLAANGVDQRIIDKHMGHQTEEMRRRYQHLRPQVCEVAVEVLSPAD